MHNRLFAAPQKPSQVKLRRLFLFLHPVFVLCETGALRFYCPVKSPKRQTKKPAAQLVEKLKGIGQRREMTDPQIRKRRQLRRDFLNRSYAIRECAAADFPSAWLLAHETLANIKFFACSGNRLVEHVAQISGLSAALRNSAQTLLAGAGSMLQQGDGVLPGFRPNRKWKNDGFAMVAGLAIFNLKAEGLDTSNVSLDTWVSDVRANLRAVVLGMLDAHDWRELEKEINASGDNKYPSRLRERVIERILDRARALLGLKAMK